MMDSRGRIIRLLALLCTLLIFPCAAFAESTDADSPMTLLAINVRKADALLLQYDDCSYLIDTGTKDSYDQLYAVLTANGITHLDGVILTHTDSDHAGGIKKLVKSDILIDQVYASAYYHVSDSKHPAVKALKGTDEAVVFLKGGDVLPFGTGSLTVLGPLSHDEDKENNNSLVLLAEGGGGSILLAGDMEFPEEAELLSAGVLPRVDVLKVGNHGNGDATSEELIRALQPTVAIISTNTEDKPSSPAARVISLLESWGITIYQTQDAESGVRLTIRNGEIVVTLE